MTIDVIVNLHKILVRFLTMFKLVLKDFSFLLNCFLNWTYFMILVLIWKYTIYTKSSSIFWAISFNLFLVLLANSERINFSMGCSRWYKKRFLQTWICTIRLLSTSHWWFWNLSYVNYLWCIILTWLQTICWLLRCRWWAYIK